MAAQTVTVQFHDQTLTAAVIDGEPYVAMKPIFENIGLVWRAQYHRIKRHPVLSSTVSMMDTVAENGKQREMLMLPLDYLNGWLFGIDTACFKPEIKDRLPTTSAIASRCWPIISCRNLMCERYETTRLLWNLRFDEFQA